MKALVARRARIARVRHVQHLQAAAAASAAEAHAASLESSAARLAELRGGLLQQTGGTSGAALGHAHELAMRLDAARLGMSDAIAGARASASASAEARLEARRRQESADKLDARANAALARFTDRRASALGRRRRGLAGETEA